MRCLILYKERSLTFLAFSWERISMILFCVIGSLLSNVFEEFPPLVIAYFKCEEVFRNKLAQVTTAHFEVPNISVYQEYQQQCKIFSHIFNMVFPR